MGPEGMLSQAQRVEELGTKWTPPKEPDWQGSGGQLAPIFKYMQDAYRFGGQPNAFYDNVGAAIQSCAVEGSLDGLGCSQLRDHIKTDPQGPRDGKGRTVPRWRSAVFAVARLLKSSGVHLRAVLKPEHEARRSKPSNMDQPPACQRVARSVQTPHGSARRHVRRSSRIPTSRVHLREQQGSKTACAG